MMLLYLELLGLAVATVFALAIIFLIVQGVVQTVRGKDEVDKR